MDFREQHEKEMKEFLRIGKQSLFVSYEGWLENRLSDEIEKNRQLIEYNKTASIKTVLGETQ